MGGFAGSNPLANDGLAGKIGLVEVPMQVVPANYVAVSNIQPEDLAKIQRQDPAYPGVLGPAMASYKFSAAELQAMGLRGLYLPANNRIIPQCQQS